MSFNRYEDELVYTITDQGEGFDWEDYLEMKPERVFDSHGRGIATANIISFDQLNFLGNGSQVEARIKLT